MRSLYLGFCLATAVVAALGCGTVKNNPDGGPIGDDDAPPIDSGGDGGGNGSFTLTATPTTLNIPIAGSAMATIAIDRTGTPGDVMLSAASPPTGISITFATNPVPAGTASTTATISVAPGTAAGVSNLTITGSGSGAQKTVTIAVTAQTITVSGKVRGERAGVKVRIPGKGLVTSGVGGGFVFTDVSPPYDLYALGEVGLSTNPSPAVFYYQGLTRPDPVITAPSTFILTLFPFGNSDTVTGTTTMAPATMLVAWEGGGVFRMNQTNTYNVTASWPSNQGATAVGNLFGFQFATDPTTGAPTAFTGYASLSGITVNSDTPPTIANLVMSAPATAALTGTLTAPAGFPKPNIVLTQQLGASSVALWEAPPGNTENANSVIPLVGAGKAALFAQATLNGATTRFVHPALAAATDVTFALPAPAVQAAPLDTATGITATTAFSWSATPGAIYEVVTSTAPGASVKGVFQLYTTAATATIPAVPELALPLNQSFTWRVNSFGPNTSLDAVASTAGLESVAAADFEGDLHWTTSGSSRTFTSSP